MKPNRFKSSEKISYAFAWISTWTGYIIGLLAVFLFSVNQEPQEINLIPAAHLFFEAAKISMELEESKKKLNKPPNQK